MSSPADVVNASGRPARGSTIVRILDLVLLTSGLSVWPHTLDRQRYAQRRAARMGEDSHELEAVFGDVGGEQV